MPANRLQEIRARLDAWQEADRHAARADLRWLLDELDAARERIAILRAEIADLEHADR